MMECKSRPGNILRPPWGSSHLGHHDYAETYPYESGKKKSLIMNEISTGMTPFLFTRHSSVAVLFGNMPSARFVTSENDGNDTVASKEDRKMTREARIIDAEYLRNIITSRIVTDLYHSMTREARIIVAEYLRKIMTSRNVTSLYHLIKVINSGCLARLAIDVTDDRGIETSCIEFMKQNGLSLDLGCFRKSLIGIETMDICSVGSFLAREVLCNRFCKSSVLEEDVNCDRFNIGKIDAGILAQRESSWLNSVFLSEKEYNVIGCSLRLEISRIYSRYTFVDIRIGQESLIKDGESNYVFITKESLIKYGESNYVFNTKGYEEYLRYISRRRNNLNDSDVISDVMEFKKEILHNEFGIVCEYCLNKDDDASDSLSTGEEISLYISRHRNKLEDSDVISDVMRFMKEILDHEFGLFGEDSLYKDDEESDSFITREEQDEDVNQDECSDNENRIYAMTCQYSRGITENSVVKKEIGDYASLRNAGEPSISVKEVKGKGVEVKVQELVSYKTVHYTEAVDKLIEEAFELSQTLYKTYDILLRGLDFMGKPSMENKSNTFDFSMRNYDLDIILDADSEMIRAKNSNSCILE